MKDLLRHAARLGYSVHVWELEPGTFGLTDTEERTITLDLRLRHDEQRSTLAHECGHAFYGHDCTSPAGERQARKYAAGLLIDPVEYARLERINPDQYWLAEEFSVTPRIIFDFENFCLTRLRNVTYARPRLGLGQWAHRGITI